MALDVLVLFPVFVSWLSLSTKPSTAVPLNLSSQRSLGGDAERPFCKLHIWPNLNWQQLFVIAHSQDWTLRQTLLCFPSLLLRSTSCVRLKSAHHVMGLVSRDASAGDGKNESAATPFNELCKMAGETLANDPGYSGSRARRGSV